MTKQPARRLAVEDFYGEWCPGKLDDGGARISGYHIYVPREGEKVCAICEKKKSKETS